MKLLLSGGGSPEQVIELDEYFSKMIGNGKVLYIPVAMDDRPYSDCYDWFTKTYNSYGITNIEMCTDLKEYNLDSYDAVFIGGGNTFKLLHEIKTAKFDIKLKEFLKAGGFIYGGSAGAIIFGESIDTASHADKNNVNLKDLKGLGILKDYKIWCHYNEETDKEEISKIKDKIILLFEESGLLFDGINFRSIGKQYIEIDN